MNSKLYTGFVEHDRFHPASHRLIYKLYMYALDLAELETLDQRFPLFGHNRLRPVSVYDRDYLGRQSVSIRRKVLEHVSAYAFARRCGTDPFGNIAETAGLCLQPSEFLFLFFPQRSIAGCID